MNTKERIKRVRAAVAAFVTNRENFPKVTLALARELWAARLAVSGDDSAFGAWLTAHRLTDKITPQDRAALIKLGEHSKVTTKILRQTSSRSVRLIWEEEVRPLVETFTSAGKGRQTAVAIISEPRAAQRQTLSIINSPSTPRELTSNEVSDVLRDGTASEVVNALLTLDHLSHRCDVDAVRDLLLGDRVMLAQAREAIRFASKLEDVLDRATHEDCVLKARNDNLH